MALTTIGQELLQPEAGWKRYDEQNKHVITTGFANPNASVAYYSLTSTMLNQSQYVKFRFTGTKIRIIARTTSASSNNIQIKIDDTVESFSAKSTTATNCALVYEKTGLTSKSYEVIITNMTTESVYLDAIDIDDTGMLGNVSKVLIQNDNSYKRYDYNSISWQTITSTTPTESDYLQGNSLEEIASIPKSAWQELNGAIELCYFTDDPSATEVQFNIETEPFTLAELFKDKQVKILEYTDNPSQTESIVETETEPYDIYDEFRDKMEVLYYTDDPNKNEAELEITANYSPLDEIEGDFEVVTWTDESNSDTKRTLNMNAVPKPHLIEQINPALLFSEIQDYVVKNANNPSKMFLLSPDGSTWKTWNGAEFSTVNVSDPFTIPNEAMTATKLSTITKEQWKLWLDEEVFLGIYLDEGDIIENISYKGIAPTESTQISDARLYILNTVSTINVSFAGSTLTGVIDDEDKGKVQYRVLLNGENYYPKDGSFTKLSPAPLDIAITLANEDILIDENNVLRVEFKDFWGTIDFWQQNFVGTYSGLLFLDETGQYYSDDVGKILQYLDFGVLIAGQTTLEQAVILRNTYGYPVENVKLRANQSEFPKGLKVQFGTNNTSFEALESLAFEGVMEDGDEKIFYMRMTSVLGETPSKTGEFDILVNASKIEEKPTE